jgi:hypothetical protein
MVYRGEEAESMTVLAFLNQVSAYTFPLTGKKQENIVGGVKWEKVGERA